MGIYMSSDIRYLLLLYLRIQTSDCDSFAKNITVRCLEAYSSALLLSAYFITCKYPRLFTP